MGDSFGRRNAVAFAALLLLWLPAAVGCKPAEPVRLSVSTPPEQTLQSEETTVGGRVSPADVPVDYSLNGGTWQALEVSDIGDFTALIGLALGDNTVTFRAVRESEEVTAAVKVRYEPILDVHVEYESPVRTATVKLVGTVTPGAAVTIEGKPCDVSADGAFSVEVPLETGENFVEVTASLEGYKSSSISYRVTRQETEAEYKKSCERIEWKSLDKNPDKYKGRRFYFKGQVFNISESGNYTEIQLYVTKGGYGWWDDQVYVTYDGTIDATEDDIIEVWGECTGAFKYTSVAGWDISVPGLKAAYIAE